MDPVRRIIVAGAGIGGLSAALALAQRGFLVTAIDRAERLEETGAGIQLSPNVTRLLLDMGIGPQLQPSVVAPQALRILKAQSGREIARMPLGKMVEERHGAPYWIAHRGDLQAALLSAVKAHPGITLNLGMTVEDFTAHANGVSVSFTRKGQAGDLAGDALVGADGLWSALRSRLGDETAPRFGQRCAYRAVIPAEMMPAAFREGVITMWLGPKAHFVHYPVKSGAFFNLVAIADDRHAQRGWSAPASREEVIDAFSRSAWSEDARHMIMTPSQWQKWSLYDRPPRRNWGRGPVTLLGDAAHPMLPYLAQGAGMAIEDAVVLADCLAGQPDAPARAMRRYEAQRGPRTAKVQRAARRNGTIYHLGAFDATLRNLALATYSKKRLLKRFDWIYGWRPA